MRSDRNIVIVGFDEFELRQHCVALIPIGEYRIATVGAMRPSRSRKEFMMRDVR